MEELKKENHPEGCRCFMCQRGHMCKGGRCGNHMIIRIILGLLILTFVFFSGFWFGNMSAILKHGGYNEGYGYNRMRGNRSMMNFDNQNSNRMMNRNAPATQNQGLNTTSTPTQ